MYKYRREDNGEIVEVDWETMMSQDAAGYITLPDGVEARRCDRKTQRVKATVDPDAPAKEMVSDTLGFPEHCFDEFEFDRKRNNFSGIEFTRDPQVPEFFQVRCSSPSEWHRYVKHRGFYEKNGINGSSAMLTPAQLEEAKAQALRHYPKI